MMISENSPVIWAVAGHELGTLVYEPRVLIAD